MNAIKRNTLLAILVLIFLAPGIAAWLFYTHPRWLAETQTNHGELLNPPWVLTELPLSGKWGLVLYSENCDKVCLNQLDQLARMRLALGRHLYQVSLSLLTDSNHIATLQSRFIQNDIEALSLLPPTRNILNRTPAQHIFIVDPKGYCILAYPLNAPPQAIFQDLKRLLTSGKDSA